MVVTGRPGQRKTGTTFKDLQSSRWYPVLLLIIFLVVFGFIAWIWIAAYL